MRQQEIDAIAMDAAVAQARKSLAEGGIPIGAALVDRDGRVVGAGHNLRVQQGDTTAHGETSAIRNAGRRRDWRTLTLASTLSPCAMCTGTAILHRIPRVVIAESVNFQGREDWLKQEGVEVVNLRDAGCIRMMAEWIAANGDLWNEDIGDPEVTK
ncbi:MAG: nucleoside deaminase [Planctomycetaceae bacterium]|jgi:creatinine deaminase|nr:nucleoside deaminase [Planctomycetaceae bacterium]